LLLSGRAAAKSVGTSTPSESTHAIDKIKASSDFGVARKVAPSGNGAGKRRGGKFIELPGEESTSRSIASTGRAACLE
jgi:hypothetical protein